MDSPRGLLCMKFAPCTRDKCIALCLCTYLTFLVVLIVILLESTSEPQQFVNKTLNNSELASLNTVVSLLPSSKDRENASQSEFASNNVKPIEFEEAKSNLAPSTTTTTQRNQTMITLAPGRPCKDRHKWCNYACCTCERRSDGSCFIRYEEPGPNGGINIHTEDI